MITVAERLLKDTCGVMSTFESNMGIEVSLPALYPNGEHVVVILNEIDGDSVTLSDGGFSLEAIASMGLALQKNATKHIIEYASMLGCSFENGRVVRRSSSANVAAAAMTVSNVCLYVASQFQVMQAEKRDFDAIVREVLESKVGSESVSPNYKILGASGASYNVTAAIMRPEQPTPIAIIEAISTPKSVSGRFRHLYDIKSNTQHANIERLSVYDNEETFSQSDFLLLQDVSNLVSFLDMPKRLSAYA